jgi:mono/diheme cytochrome c family protein
VGRRFWLAIWLLSLIGCSQRALQRDSVKPSRSAVPATLPTPSVAVGSPRGDAARGYDLVQRFECNRCHEGTGTGVAPMTKNCFSCHEQIISGRFPASAAALARFRPHVASAREAPSLIGLGARLEERWVVEYLLAPHDLRPQLMPTMPRLALGSDEARDIVAYLMGNGPRSPPPSSAPGNARRGRELMEQKGCATCHAFSGVPAFKLADAPPAASDAARAAALAPDLRFTRQRFRTDRLLAWLLDPQALKPDTRMPNFGFSRAEAADVAAYLLGAALALEPAPRFERLPLLSRSVSFEEANRRVFSRTCHHCHTDADSAGGDGGPGNTGGFGFAPRGVSFSSHASILAGYIDAKGKRRSLFEPLADGTPRLVAALLARHDELRSAPRDAVRGMPLGLPPLSAVDIQLVESWVAQGKPL